VGDHGSRGLKVTWGKLIGAQVADMFGRSEHQPSLTSVEEIWRRGVLSPKPEKAAEAIKALQLMLDTIEAELHEIMVIVGK
jgi:hypothetical protein